jgi:signal peptidase II
MAEQESLEPTITHRTLGITCGIFAIIIDQINKSALIDVMYARALEPITVTGYFNLVMAWNKGVSFSMLAEHDARYPLVVMALIVSGFLFVWMWQEADKAIALSLGLIIGGAVSNAIDRINYGAVADFFDFHLIGYHWPAFNLADSFIFIGVAILLWRSFRGA